MTIKFYRQLLKKCEVEAIFLMTSGEQMSNSYAFCFNEINFVIPSYTELPFDE